MTREHSLHSQTADARAAGWQSPAFPVFASPDPGRDLEMDSASKGEDVLPGRGRIGRQEEISVRVIEFRPR